MLLLLLGVRRKHVVVRGNLQLLRRGVRVRGGGGRQGAWESLMLARQVLVVLVMVLRLAGGPGRGRDHARSGEGRGCGAGRGVAVLGGRGVRRLGHRGCVGLLHQDQDDAGELVEVFCACAWSRRGGSTSVEGFDADIESGGTLDFWGGVIIALIST